MPADFNQAIQVVLANEGGYSFNPADPGGETNFGISKRAYPNLDIKHLTQSQAEEIYRHDYWLFGDLNSQAVATKMLDMGVNMGLKHGISIGQEATVKLGSNIKVDGEWGPKTEAALNSLDEVPLLSEIRTEQSMYYTNLVAQKPQFYPFLRGWLRRVQSC